MAYDIQRLTFAESSWKRLAKTDVPLQKTKELVRYVEKIVDTQRATDLLFLYTYVSTANNASDATATARSYVDSPQADRCTYAGRWRLASNVVDPQLKRYVQTLRLGYATTIDWTESFLVNGNYMTGTERDLVVEFRNIDPKSLETCMASLRSNTPWTNPTIQTETYTGKWMATNIQPRQEADGIYTIVLTLGKISVIDDVGDFDSLTPLKEYTRDVDHAFGEAGGYTTHVAKSATDGIIFTYKRLDPDCKDFVNAMTDAQFQALLSATEELTYEFVKKDFKEMDEDHTWTLKLAYRRVDRINWTNQAAHITEYANQNTAMETRTRHWLGIDKADETTVIAALINGGALDDVSGYVVTAVGYSDNDDGSMNWRQVLQKEGKGSTGTNPHHGGPNELEAYGYETIDAFAIKSGKHYTLRIINENLERVSNAYDVIASSRSSNFALMDVQEQHQDNGLWSKVYVYKYSEWDAWTGAAPQLTIYENQTTYFERRRRYWFGYDVAYRDQAEADLKQDSGSLGNVTNYVVTEISVTDNKNGSMTVVQTLEYARVWPAACPSPDMTEKFNVGNTNEGYTETFWSYRCHASGALQQGVSRATSQLQVAKAGYFYTIDIQDRQNGIFDAVRRYFKDSTSVTVPGWVIGHLQTVTYRHRDEIEDKKGYIQYQYTTYTVSINAHATYLAAVTRLATATPAPLAHYGEHRSEVKQFNSAVWLSFYINPDSLTPLGWHESSKQPLP